jgi:hypothetical protein
MGRPVLQAAFSAIRYVMTCGDLDVSSTESKNASLRT